MLAGAARCGDAAKVNQIPCVSHEVGSVSRKTDDTAK